MHSGGGSEPAPERGDPCAGGVGLAVRHVPFEREVQRVQRRARLQHAAALEEAREAMGELADLSCIECIITSDRARSELGWLPIAPSVATELSVGSYHRGKLVPYSH